MIIADPNQFKRRLNIVVFEARSPVKEGDQYKDKNRLGIKHGLRPNAFGLALLLNAPWLAPRQHGA